MTATTIAINASVIVFSHQFKPPPLGATGPINIAKCPLAPLKMQKAEHLPGTKGIFVVGEVR